MRSKDGAKILARDTRDRGSGVGMRCRAIREHETD